MKTLKFLTIAVLFSAISCFADSMQTIPGALPLANNLNSSATLSLDTTTKTFTLDFNIDNSSATTATINAFSLQLFGGSNGSLSVLSRSLPAGWESFDNQKINNNGSTGCTGKDHPGWLCADDNLNPLAPLAAQILAGHSLDFTFTGSYTGAPVNPLDLMANGLTDINNGNSKWSVSAGMNTPVTQVPEPSSFLLLAFGFLAVGPTIYRKLK
jgi:PEP-CTERM motif